MAIAMTLPGFKDLGRLVTFIFLSKTDFVFSYLQLFTVMVTSLHGDQKLDRSDPQSFKFSCKP